MSRKPGDDPIERAVIEHLDRLDADYRIMPCDPSLADTAAFCEHYGVDPAISANAILIASRRPPGHAALCLALATTRLDVNRKVRELLGVRKLSFAPPEITKELTGMEIGGVTPFGLLRAMPVYVDAAVVDLDRCVVGGGSRSMKIDVDPEVFRRLEGAEIVAGMAS
jgi:prolyl-tRNA editing enzyme YbaK/EbsC (Cys-tRNA(Pro) deacylase)